MLSILTPMKNADAWIEDCILSIQSQSFENWELIIIDDFSEDNSYHIVNRYQYLDSRIKLLRNQKPGIINALRKAFSISSGEYIHRMDADDLMPENKLKTLLSIARQNKQTVATGRVIYFSENKISEGYINYQNWLNERCTAGDHWCWIYRECVIASANWITHRDNISFENDVYPEDYALVFDWYKKGLTVTATDKVTHSWREHLARTSRRSENYGQKAFFAMKVNQFIKNELNHDRSIHLIGRNQKQKLCQEICLLNGIEPLVLTLSNFHQNKHELSNGKILICIYPEEPERNQLLTELSALGLKIGEDFWFV